MGKDRDVGFQLVEFSEPVSVVGYVNVGAVGKDPVGVVCGAAGSHCKLLVCLA